MSRTMAKHDNIYDFNNLHSEKNVFRLYTAILAYDTKRVIDSAEKNPRFLHEVFLVGLRVMTSDHIES